MQPDIDIGDLVFGVINTLVALYFLLGLFSDARWLRPSWDAQFLRHPPGVPFSYFSRLVWLAFCSIFAAHGFATAFHSHVTGLTHFGIPLLVTFIVFMIFCRIRDGRHFKIEHDPDA
jgi:hypothetical protein